jgi:hypothetical protein
VSYFQDSMSPTDGWTPMRNHWFRDPRMSAKAKGRLAYIATHDKNYRLTVTQMIAEGKGSRDSVYAELAELCELGYLERGQPHGDNGKFGEYVYRYGPAAYEQQYERAWGVGATAAAAAAAKKGKQPSKKGAGPAGTDGGQEMPADPTPEDKTAGQHASGFSGSGKTGSGETVYGGSEPKKTKEKEDQGERKPPPPTPPTAAAAEPVEGGAGKDPFQNPNADLNAFVTWFYDQRPDWRRSLIANALVELTHDRRCRGVPRSAALVLRELVADEPHGRTSSPRRAAHDGAWWAVLRPVRPAPEQGGRKAKCDDHPWEIMGSCTSCKGDAKAREDDTAGVKLPQDSLRQLVLDQQLQRVLARNVGAGSG